MSKITVMYFRLFPDRAFSRAINNTQKEFTEKLKLMPNGIEKQNLHAEMVAEISFIREEWRSIKTENLLNKAIKYDLDIPIKPKMQEDNEFWSWSSFGHILNPKSIRSLKRIIREEKEYKRNILAFYSGILMGILGLIISLLTIIN